MCQSRERKREPWSFMRPRGADVSSLHAQKNPPERGDKMAPTLRFLVVQVCFIKRDFREHFEGFNEGEGMTG